MEFFLTQMPNSFLGKLEGFIFFLMFAGAVFFLHRLHNREERIIIEVQKPKPKSTKK